MYIIFKSLLYIYIYIKYLVAYYLSIYFVAVCIKSKIETLHSYNLIWAVCHLFPQRWRTFTYSVSGNHWQGEPRDLLRTTSARKFSSCFWNLLQDAYFL